MEKQARENSSYLDFFKTRGNRWRLAIIISIGVISQYSGNAVISNYANLIYESAGITSQTQKLGVRTIWLLLPLYPSLPPPTYTLLAVTDQSIQLTLGNTTLSLIVSISAALFVDKVGRRPLFLTAIVGMYWPNTHPKGTSDD
jgi:hypothetical protein